MIRRAAAILAMGLAWTSVAQAGSGLQVDNGKLLDSNGKPFLFRGMSFPYTWYTSQLQTSIPAIAATGANSVRVVMATGGRWTRTSATEVRQIINLVKANKMVAVLEVHDCTGWSEEGAAKPIGTAVDYWLSSDIKAELDGQEAYVIVNIANEPFGNTTSAKVYVDSTKSAIARLRRGGLKHTLMVDGATWGQDMNNTMRDSGASIIAADSLSNTMLSVHMYQIYSSATAVENYLKAASAAHLPLLVGEFADHSDNSTTVAAQSIMQLCAKYGFGYMGWSWKGNSSGGDSLDIAKQWNGSVLSAWGKLLVEDPAGIKATSQLATIFTADDGKKLVLAYAQGQGTVSATYSGRVDTGKSDTIRAAAAAGYDFAGWSGDTAGTQMTGPVLVIPKIAKDYTIQANFKAGAGTSLIKGGAFAGADSTNWSLSVYPTATNAATVSFSGGNAKVTPTQVDTNVWSIQLCQAGLSVDSGTAYELQFDASASVARAFSFGIVHNGNVDQNWSLPAYVYQTGSLTTSAQSFAADFTPDTTDKNVILQINVGKYLPSVTIDNVALVKKSASVSPRASLSRNANWTLVRNGAAISWTRSEAIASAGTLRLVDAFGRELSRSRVPAGSRSGAISAPASGVAFLVLETSGAREIRTLPPVR